MKTTSQDTWAPLISRALHMQGEDVVSCASNCWRFTLRNGTLLRASAVIADDWLRLCAPLSVGEGEPASKHPAELWELLHRNAYLETGVKYGLALSGEPFVCADVLLEEEVDVEARIRKVCENLRMASELAYREDTGELSGAGEGPADVHPDLTELCDDLGWPCTKRAGGELAIELDVPNKSYFAIVGHTVDLRISTSFQIPEAPSLPCRRALAVFLQTASRHVRMVRASANGKTAGFEVGFIARPSPSEFDHALSALSVATRLCIQEVSLLRDESIAVRYLDAQGGYMQ